MPLITRSHEPNAITGLTPDAGTIISNPAGSQIIQPSMFSISTIQGQTANKPDYPKQHTQKPRGIPYFNAPGTGARFPGI